MENKEYYNILIIKFLYKLSLLYPFMNTEFKLTGVNNITGHINLYGDIYQDDKLRIEIKSIEAMMRDKPKCFKFISVTTPSSYAKSAGAPKELNYFFEMYRKELRGDKLNNLLGDE